MFEPKFKVYCEFEIDGKLYKEIEETASWFLLTQPGQLFSYDTMGRLYTDTHKKYKKTIPLFYIGKQDKNKKDIYEDDIFEVTDGDGWVVGTHLAKMDAETLSIDERCIGKILGSIHKNPELQEKLND